MTTSSNAANVTAEEAIKLYLPSVLGYEKIARGAAEAVAQELDFQPARIEDLKTAVAEACMNAIEHGNALERATMVSVLINPDPDKIEVRVADVGRQPVPDTLPDPGSGDLRGWGFFFIKRLVDEMEITQLPDGGNQVRMVIYLTPPAQAAETAQAAEPAKPTAAEQPAAPEKPAAQVPDHVPPQAIQPAAPKPQRAIQPAEPKPSAIQPAEEKPGAIQPADTQPRAIQRAAPPDTAVQVVEDSSSSATGPAGSTPPGTLESSAAQPDSDSDTSASSAEDAQES